MLSSSAVFVIIAFITNCGIAENTPKLNVPRVLLPIFNEFFVNFSLDVSGSSSCYKWSTNRPDLISIDAQYKSKSCSRNALITVLTKEKGRKTAIIMAENVSNAQSLTADVIIDEIASLSIVTKSRELYIEEPPQMFEVRAYDTQGNEFTTLAGIEFQWTIGSSVYDLHKPVMRLMTFSDSSYETPQSVANFDNIGKYGHIVLLEGIDTGKAKALVQLPHIEYKDVPVAEVEVYIVANLILDPATAYILPGDTIELKLFQMSFGKKVEINIMDKQYILVSQNEGIATVEHRTVSTHASGMVEIFVRDLNFNGSDNLNLPSALLTVSEPHYMVLTMVPYTSWGLTIRQTATIIPELYTENHLKFHIGDNTRIMTKVPDLVFGVQIEYKNGSVTGTSYAIGGGIVSAVLVGTPLVSLDIRAENILSVFPPLSISPTTIVLPWIAHITKRLSSYSLKAFGCDNNFIWTSEDTSVLEVTQSGTLVFKGPGSTTVTARMKDNEGCKASTTVHLLVPETISILDDVNEAEVGIDINLNIVLYGRRTFGRNELVPFSECGFLDFTVMAVHPFRNSDHTNEKPKKNACAVRSLKSTTSSKVAKVTIYLNNDRNILRASTTVAAYKPLISIQPVITNEVTLAMGSSYDIVFSGGPQPAFGPIEPIICYKKSFITTEVKVERSEFFVYKVTCIKLGTTTFELYVTTSPIGFIGIEMSKNVSISCRIPSHIDIIGNLKTGCSEIIPQRMVSYPLSTDHYDIILRDDKGNIFNNATSILFNWMFDNETIASFASVDSIFLQEKSHQEYSTPSKHYVIVNTHNHSGDAIAQGNMLGYKLQQSNFYPLDIYRDTSDGFFVTFMLSVVEEATVEPNFLSLFNHPANVAHLKIKGGSGHFNVNLGSPIAVIKYNYKNRIVEVSPISHGYTEIIIHDKCLDDTSPFKVELQVLRISSMTITTPLKIQEGLFTTVTIRVFDKDEKPLAFPLMHCDILGLRLEVSDKSVAEFEILNNSHIDYLKGKVTINLKAKKLGQVSIWANWLDISSNILSIQVFPKIRINPRHVILAVGSEFQMKVSGGPLLDSYTQFMIGDALITSVSNDAIIRGIRTGHTTVTVIAMGYQGEVYSKDTIEVQVVPLTGVQIVAPITKLGLGNTMPVWAGGIPHSISPMLLGSIFPPVQFKWQTSNPNVIQIRDALYNTNIQVSSESKLSVRIFGLNPGTTKLELFVYGRHQDKSHFVYNNSISITIVNDLHWIKPSVEFKPLLMAPNSVYSLRTNAPEGEIQKISAMNIWRPYIDGSQTNLLEVTPDSLVHSGPNFGTALVMVRSSGKSLSTQEVDLFVQIKPVHYLMINVETPLETIEDMKSLPRGLYLNMTISYHDVHGYKFFVAPKSKPSYQCNICSKIHIEYLESNHSFTTSLGSAGNVILRIHNSFERTEMEDFIKIPVDNYIVPNKHYLTVGEIICFWTPLISQNGVWSVDTNIMSVNKHGVAIAKRTGTTNIIYSVSYPDPQILSTITVEIAPLLTFLIGPVEKKIITNGLNNRYVIPVFLINEKQKREPFYSKHCTKEDLEFTEFPFYCTLHYTAVGKLYPVESVFVVSQEFDFERGAFVCVITSVKGTTKDISVIESNLTLHVSNRRSIYETFFLNFHPQFFVNTATVRLIRGQEVSHITITGTAAVLANIFVETDKPNLISVGSARFMGGKMIHFPVKFEYFKWGPVDLMKEEINVLITCPLTGQKEKVRVYFDDSGTITFIGYLLSCIYEILYWFVTYAFQGLTLQNAVASVIAYAFLAYPVYKWIASNILLKDYQQYKAQQEMKFLKSLNQNIRTTQKAPSRPLMASPKFVKSTAPWIETRPTFVTRVSNRWLEDTPPGLGLFEDTRSNTSLYSSASSNDDE